MSYKLRILNGNESDIENISELFNLVWPNTNHFEKTKWAFGDLYKGKLVAAIDNDHIVGMRGSIKWPLKITESEINVNQLHGTGVHPNYRRKQIFSNLNLRYIEEFSKDKGDAIFNVSVLNSKLGYQKLGWKYVDGLVRLIKPVNPLKTLFKLKGNILKLRGEMKVVSESSEEINFKEVEKYWNWYKEEINSFNYTDYNESFFEWRFSNKTAGYKYILMDEIGFCAYKIGYRAKLKEVLIGVIWTKKKNISTLIKKIIEVEKPELINIIMSKSHPQYKTFKNNMFFNDPKGSLFLGIKSLSKKGDLLLNPEKWALTTSDIDTF